MLNHVSVVLCHLSLYVLYFTLLLFTFADHCTRKYAESVNIYKEHPHKCCVSSSIADWYGFPDSDQIDNLTSERMGRQCKVTLHACKNHITHIKGPAGVMNSAQLRSEPDLTFLNGTDPVSTALRKQLVRTRDQLKLCHFLLYKSAVEESSRRSMSQGIEDFVSSLRHSIPFMTTGGRLLFHLLDAECAPKQKMHEEVLNFFIMKSNGLCLFDMEFLLGQHILSHMASLMCTYLATWVTNLFQLYELPERRRVSMIESVSVEESSISVEGTGLPGTFTASMQSEEEHQLCNTMQWPLNHWELGLPRSLAKLVVTSQSLADRFDSICWPQIVKILDSSDFNIYQFISAVSTKLSHAFLLISNASLCVARKLLIRRFKKEQDEGKWLDVMEPHFVQKFLQMLPPSILFNVCYSCSSRSELRNLRYSCGSFGLSSKKLHAKTHALSISTIQHRSSSVVYREMMTLHAMDKKLVLPPQRALGIMAHCGINRQEVESVLSGLCLVPVPNLSKLWLQSAADSAYRYRVKRLARMPASTVRFDNMDEGDLHALTAMITEDIIPSETTIKSFEKLSWYPFATTDTDHDLISAKTLKWEKVYCEFSPPEQAALDRHHSVMEHIASHLCLEVSLPESMAAEVDPKKKNTAGPCTFLPLKGQKR